ncbi:MAG: phosphoadenylyl-sulfate reductase [Phycisphaeraceae bacterium]|nr:phosphoadenylyl-sulfate reductase [Phycisphaeraceae bacterium]
MSATAEAPSIQLDLDQVNRQLEDADALTILRWAADTFGPGLVMTSSFGAQAAVTLHLAVQVMPDMPVIAIDTGYLFPETYTFAEELTKKLKLNVKWFSANITSARQEALYGKMWDQGEEGYSRYHWLNKIEPMQRAIKELNVTAWIAGLRAGQTEHRAKLRTVELQNGIYKVHPILKWTTKDVHDYLTRNDLPYHPLYEQGYASIGDTHSSAPITADGNERAGRFKGLKQECGLHLPQTRDEDQSRQASGL